ncbi:MAG: trehalase family glycosidase [bacterium]|nr:trehalase family glycosidase [bacterium]
MALASEIPSEAIYLKNWCLNYLEHVRPDGFTPGLLTPNGIDHRLKHIKPFLAQGAYFASMFLNEFEWIRPHFSTLKRSVLYRERHNFDAKRGLACWYDSMESGADNNVAALNYPKGTVVATDLNTFLYREYHAVSHIAKKLGMSSEATFFRHKANAIKEAINTYLWDSEDGIFYNIDRRTGEYIKRVSYSSIIPLWGQVAPLSRGKTMIRRYLLNPKKLRGRYGIRTLSADDPDYNQKNIIKPYSNWQGPVWPLFNYLSMSALLSYGFRREAQWLAEVTVRLCLADIKKSGGMHENYHSEKGTPLAAPNFVSWNLLVGQMLSQTKTNTNPFQIV